MYKKIIIIMVVIMFVDIGLYFDNNTVDKANISNQPDSFQGLTLNNNAKLVYKQSNTQKGSGGCIWSTLYVYETGNNHLIWILKDTINANNNNWIAGDVPNGGSHYSGREYMCNAEYRIPAYCPVCGNLPFNHNGFTPLNTIGSGRTVETVTYGVSYGSSEVACGDSLSGTYSVEFSYKIPQFDIKPIYHKPSQTEWKLSDNCFNDDKPTSVTWYTAATTSVGSGCISMTYKSYATFAHTGDFWVTAYNHVCNKETASFTV